jgi:hypothetical protein
MSLSRSSKFPVKNFLQLVNNKLPRPSFTFPPFVSKVLKNFNLTQWNEDDKFVNLKDKYKLSRASPKDIDQIKFFIERNYFCNEPLTSSLKMCYKKIDDGPFERLIRDILSQGTSLIVTGRNDKIIGLCLCRKFCSWHSHYLDELANNTKDIKMKKFLKIWSLLSHNASIELHNSLANEDIFDLSLVWADNKNVRLDLVRTAVILARDLNYSIAKIDCTNIHLQRIAEELNMKMISEIHYNKIFIDNGNSLLLLPTSQLKSHASTFILKLNDKDKNGNLEEEVNNKF